MMRNTLLALAAAASLLAAAAVLAPGSQAPTAGPIDDLGYAPSKPRYLKGRFLETCHEEAIECGLVVW